MVDFDSLKAVKTALDAAEKLHPYSRALAMLHARLVAALDAHKSMVTDDQYVALGGGTNKEPGT